MNRKDTLKHRIAKARKELDEIEEKEANDLNRSLVGRCYKTRNNYSCPEKPSDYWFMYVKVVAIESGGVVCQQFQTDKHGECTVTKRMWNYGHSVERYTEISKTEYAKAFNKMLGKIEAMS